MRLLQRAVQGGRHLHVPALQDLHLQAVCCGREAQSRSPRPHVLDAHAVSWDGWERGPNRPAQPARPRGRLTKVVDKGRMDALAEAATAAATATATDRQADQPANAASDAIAVSCHPIVPTIAPAADSSHKRTVSALGSVELPPSKHVKISQPDQVLPNQLLPSINTLLQSLPEEFRTCPQNPTDYFSCKEHLDTKKYFSSYHLPLHKSLAGFSTGNQGHNHGRLPKDHFSARLPLPSPSIPIPQEFSATSSHPTNLGTGFSSDSRVFNQENSACSSSSLHRNNNNELVAGPSASRRHLNEFRPDPPGFSSAPQVFLLLPKFLPKKTPPLRLRLFIEITVTNSALALRPLVNTWAKSAPIPRAFLPLPKLPTKKSPPLLRLPFTNLFTSTTIKLPLALQPLVKAQTSYITVAPSLLQRPKLSNEIARPCPPLRTKFPSSADRFVL